MLAQIPDVRFVAGKARAVNARLLARANADGLPARGVADGVGLGVFQRNQGDDEIARGVLRQIFVLGDNLAEERVVDLQIVAPLLKGNAKHVFQLYFRGNILRVDLHDVIAAFALFQQNLHRLFGVARRDYAVGDLAGKDGRRRLVAHIGQGRPVAV